MCRISMESPSSGCGFGMSTLLPTPGKVGTGSMVWGCSGGGFQCNFIDPECGQFPFLVKPHAGLDNGFAFLATQTGTSVFRQTVALWKTIQAGRLPRLASPCAIFVDGEPVADQTATDLPDAPQLWVTHDNVRRAAVRLDFSRHYQGRLAVNAASPQEPVTVVAKPLGGGRPIELLRADAPGQSEIELNRSFKPDQVALVLEVPASGPTLTLTETLPLQPEILSPVADASVTDLAVMFRWKAIPLLRHYPTCRHHCRRDGGQGRAGHGFRPGHGEAAARDHAPQPLGEPGRHRMAFPARAELRWHPGGANTSARSTVTGCRARCSITTA
jgi:hypothetical protein